jgi:hypothetical protein
LELGLGVSLTVLLDLVVDELAVLVADISIVDAVKLFRELPAILFDTNKVSDYGFNEDKL